MKRIQSITLKPEFITTREQKELFTQRQAAIMRVAGVSDTSAETYLSGVTNLKLVHALNVASALGVELFEAYQVEWEELDPSGG